MCLSSKRFLGRGSNERERKGLMWGSGKILAVDDLMALYETKFVCLIQRIGGRALVGRIGIYDAWLKSSYSVTWGIYPKQNRVSGTFFVHLMIRVVALNPHTNRNSDKRCKWLCYLPLCEFIRVVYSLLCPSRFSILSFSLSQDFLQPHIT